MAKRMAKNLPKKRNAEVEKVLRQQKLTRWIKVTSLMSILFACLASLIYVSYRALDRPLDKVELNAAFERVSTLEVEKVLANYKQAKFLSIDLNGLQKELEKVAWVDVAEVRRSFPAKLMITLTEHVAAARWGEAGLLNTRGELILKQARYLPPELPRLEGPNGSEWQVAQKYLELRKTVLGFGLNIEYLSMDARGAWRFNLSNGMQVKIGREATDQRFYRFENRVLPLLFKLEQGVQSVDMRYSNGFAVQWQKLESNENDTELKKQEKTSYLQKYIQIQLMRKILGDSKHA